MFMCFKVGVDVSIFCNLLTILKKKKFQNWTRNRGLVDQRVLLYSGSSLKNSCSGYLTSQLCLGQFPFCNQSMEQLALQFSCSGVKQRKYLSTSESNTHSEVLVWSLHRRTCPGYQVLLFSDSQS